jgi:glutathione S-transferase
MLILRSSPFSPFGRKIKIALASLGLLDQVKVVVADTLSDSDTLRKENPLGKIPCLILEDGVVLYDSRVILEYLDGLGKAKIIPRVKDKKYAALTLQSLADGILDAGILMRYETVFRDEPMRSEKWTSYQRAKVTRALEVLEANPPKWRGTPNVGIIAVACALGYQDLRFDGVWRKSYPKLVKWLKDFEKRVPSFDATRPENQK